MTREELIRDLRATYPRLAVFSDRPWSNAMNVGVDIAGDGSMTMPDGLPIFTELMYGEPTHDGGAHTAFSSWLEARGWYLEKYDAGRYCAVPLPSVQEISEWNAACARIAESHVPLPPGQCPF